MTSTERDILKQKLEDKMVKKAEMQVKAKKKEC